MKKINIFSCLAALLALSILIFPIKAYAINKSVTITDSSINSTSVSVSGTSEALAVIVQVRDESNNILGMVSLGTLNTSFSGSVTGLSLAEGKTYTIYVADYEGGDWATTNVVIPVNNSNSSNTSTDSSDSSSSSSSGSSTAAPVKDSVPKTGDSNTVPFVLIALGIVSLSFISAFTAKKVLGNNTK